MEAGSDEVDLTGRTVGQANDHAVPGNLASLQRFPLEVSKSWLRVIQRRSQQNRMSSKRTAGFVTQWLTRPLLWSERTSLLMSGIEGRRTYDGDGTISTGSLAASHPTIPPAISPTDLNPPRCNRLAAMEDR